MANAYYELVNELWNGSNSSLSPWDFRQIFIRFAKQVTIHLILVFRIFSARLSRNANICS